MDRHRDDLVADVTAAMSDSAAAIAGDAARGVLLCVQQHLGDLDRKFDDMVVQQKAMVKQNEELLQKVNKLVHQMASLSHSASSPSLPTCSSPTPGPAVPNVTASPFWRAPDPTLLKCNTHGNVQVSIKEFYPIIVKLAEEANIGEDRYEVSGDELDNRFEIRFIGATAQAATVQFFQSINRGRGKYKAMDSSYFISAPAGGAVQFYINPDKNAATIRKEILCRKVQEVVAPLITDGSKCFTRRPTGSVCLGRVLCSVVIQNDNSARLAWHQPLAIHHKLDMASIDEQFKVVAGLGPLP